MKFPAVVGLATDVSTDMTGVVMGGAGFMGHGAVCGAGG